MSSYFNITVASCVLGNVRIKAYFNTQFLPLPPRFAGLFTVLPLLVQCVPTKIKYRQKLSHNSTPMYVSGTVFTNIAHAPMKIILCFLMPQRKQCLNCWFLVRKMSQVWTGKTLSDSKMEKFGFGWVLKISNLAGWKKKPDAGSMTSYNKTVYSLH